MLIGKFLTVEGQDGAGKSTNIVTIEKVLVAKNIDYIKTREPGGTAFGEKIREIILNSKDDEFGDTAELLLVFAARAEHIETIIKPALIAGKWVLCDRFTDATYAYQGAGRGIKKHNIEVLEKLVQVDLQPDLTLLLDLPVEVGESRAGARSEADRFEQQLLDFKQRVRDCYLQIANEFSNRVVVIDANNSIKKVEELMTDAIEKFIKHSSKQQ